MVSQNKELNTVNKYRIDRDQPGKENYLFTVNELQSWRWQRKGRPKIQTPEAVIFCMQPTLFDQARRRYSGKRVKDFFGDCYLIKKSQGKVALASGFGIGAPAIAIAVEEYAAFGVRNFVAIGTAGALQPSLETGNVVLCERAVRGEGTSGHYLPLFAPASSDSEVLASLCKSLLEQHIQPVLGVSWTTDAPYRETKLDADRHREDGVLTVEMEAAAFFAASESLGAKAGAIFIVADRLLPGRWEPPINMSVIQKNLLDVLSAIVSSLTGEKS